MVQIHIAEQIKKQIRYKRKTMKPFLFSYTSEGQRVYKLVYSHSASEAETKLSKIIYYLSNPDIKLETILE